MATKRKLQSAALQYMYDKFICGDLQQEVSYEQELTDIEVAKQLYDLRTKAGLSQRELAKMVGTTASSICRLEDDDYEGHSLSMLRRIAAALDKRIEIRFVPIKNAHPTSVNRARRKHKPARKGRLQKAS